MALSSTSTTALLGLLVMGGAVCATPAAAQATRTWVSGVGDDVNPCSRTAPCKTFAGAISKTATGGEINCLDPAGFGTLTIIKSITVDCTGTFGSVLNSGGINGIIINDGASGTPGTANVILRGITINGAGTTPGLNGIRFVTGASLTLQDVFIENQKNGSGIAIQPTLAMEFHATNVTVANGGNGILIQAGASAGTRVSLSDVRVSNNANSAIRIETAGPAGVLASVDNVVLGGNGSGLSLNQPVGASGADVMLTNSVVNNNSGIGIATTGAGMRVLVGNTTVFANGTGLSVGTGQIRSFGTNRVEGNGSDGAFTAPVLPQK
jgi:hypothetical protein